MKIVVAGDKFDFDWDKIHLREMYALKEKTGLTLKAWRTAIIEEEPDALAFLVWLLWTRDGRAVDFADVDFMLGEVDVIDDEAREVPTDATTPTLGAVAANI